MELSFRVSADVSGVEDHLEALHDAVVEIFCGLGEEFGAVSTVLSVAHRDVCIAILIYTGDRPDELYLLGVYSHGYLFLSGSVLEVSYVDLSHGINFLIHK